MDITIFNALHSWAGIATIGDWLAVVGAKYLPWGVGLAMFSLAFRDRATVKRIENLVFAALAVLVARGVVTELIRYLLPRERPFVALGFEPLVEQSLTSALPSGHAATLFALAAAAWFMNHRWGYWLGAFALVNGIARVVVGVHWPLDILVGAAVGIVSALLMRLLLNKIPQR